MRERDFSAREHVRLSILLEQYGQLLTERQRQYLDMHYNQDMSLAEIAREQGVSRQAVHDAIKHGREHLEDFASKLEGGVHMSPASRSEIVQIIAQMSRQIAMVEGEVRQYLAGSIGQLKTALQVPEEIAGRHV